MARLVVLPILSLQDVGYASPVESSTLLTHVCPPSSEQFTSKQEQDEKPHSPLASSESKRCRKSPAQRAPEVIPFFLGNQAGLAVVAFIVGILARDGGVASPFSVPLSGIV